MAERRMFAKSIIDSDAFLDMPMSARLLYYDLAMRADDDGFINAPKKIARFTGASLQDLDVLIANKFLIPFSERGVVVVKHWFIHNYIRKDMYKPTNYKEELALLDKDENNAYTLSKTLLVTDSSRTCNEPVTNPSTQVRLGKDRIGKDRIGKDSICESASLPTPQDVIDLYHSICISYPKVVKITDARKKAIRARLKQYSLDELKEVFTKAEESNFLKGDNKNNWSASFDWLLNSNNIIKVLEGNYDNKAPSSKPAPSNQDGYDWDSY